eukprot:403368696
MSQLISLQVQEKSKLPIILISNSLEEIDQYLRYIGDIVIGKREARVIKERFVSRPQDSNKFQQALEPIFEEPSEQISEVMTKDRFREQIKKDKFQKEIQDEINQFNIFKNPEEITYVRNYHNQYIQGDRQSSIYEQSPFNYSKLGPTQKSWYSGVPRNFNEYDETDRQKVLNRSQIDLSKMKKDSLRINQQAYKPHGVATPTPFVNQQFQQKWELKQQRSVNIHPFFGKSSGMESSNTQTSETTSAFDEETSGNLDQILDQLAQTFDENLNI